MDIGKEINIKKHWRTLWEWKRALILSFLGPAIITMIISLLWPKSYTASVSFLSPNYEEAEGLGIQFGFSSGGTKEGALPPEAIVGILESERMLYDIIDNFNLLKKLNLDKRYTAKNMLRDELTEIEFNPQKPTMTIKVTTRSPKLSADISNYYVKNLDKINRELSLTARTPLVKVIDWASPPEKKSKPKTKYNMVIAGTIGLLLCLFILYVKVTFESEKID